MSSVARHGRCRAAWPITASACALMAACPATAQQYGVPSRHGDPYAPPPAYRRALDGTTPRSSLKDAPPRQYVRPGIWQGLYLGGHGGFGFGSMAPNGAADSVDLAGAQLGLHAGYNAQIGSSVLGLEFDGTWSDISGTRSFAGPVDVHGHASWLSSLRLRAGYAIDNMLIYATGGVALGGFDATIAAGGIPDTASRTAFGYVVGGGFEMKFNPNWSGRVEALYYGFDSKTFDFSGGGLPIDTGIGTIRAGITYHF